MTQRKRDWAFARGKLEAEGCCRVCGPLKDHHAHVVNVIQCAHIIGREHDRYAPMRAAESGWAWDMVVVPDRIVPLCLKHHQAYDAHELDLLPYLTEWEVHQAIADCARSDRMGNGLAKAVRRICGNGDVFHDVRRKTQTEDSYLAREGLLP